jgi:polyribonucleotide nucleotidyltransferase
VVRVKVLETDEKGRVKLSMKALLDRPEHPADHAPTQGHDADGGHRHNEPKNEN